MRLAKLDPPLPVQLVASLEAIDLRTESDLLSFSAPDILRRLPAGTVSLEELMDYIDLVAEQCASPGISGYDLLRMQEQANAKSTLFLTGLQELDALLEGLGGGKVVELSGDKLSGKTTLALNWVVRQLSGSPRATAIWLDTTGEFPAFKASQILEGIQAGDPTTVLERLQVSLAFDLDAAQEVLSHLSSDADANLSFLVIDVITPLLAPILSAASAQGHALMVDFMRQLQSVAQASGAAVIVINNTAKVSAGSLEKKPALGPSFALMADTMLWLRCLSPTESANNTSHVHKVEVLKSASISSGSSFNFRIIEGLLVTIDA